MPPGKYIRTPEIRKKNSESVLGHDRTRLEKNPAWKGDKVGYKGIHEWLSRHATKKGVCQKCKKRPKPWANRKFGTEWANISGRYLRRLDDYIELCCKCHYRFDRIVRPQLEGANVKVEPTLHGILREVRW